VEGTIRVIPRYTRGLVTKEVATVLYNINSSLCSGTGYQSPDTETGAAGMPRATVWRVWVEYRHSMYMQSGWATSIATRRWWSHHGFTVQQRTYQWTAIARPARSDSI